MSNQSVVGGVSAVVEYDPIMRRHKVWVLIESSSGQQVLDPDKGWARVDPGARPAPSYVFDQRGVLAAIVAAASDVLPPSAATDRHLADAVEVRDRLLSMVEGWALPPTRTPQ